MRADEHFKLCVVIVTIVCHLNWITWENICTAFVFNLGCLSQRKICKKQTKLPAWHCEKVIGQFGAGWTVAALLTHSFLCRHLSNSQVTACKRCDDKWHDVALQGTDRESTETRLSETISTLTKCQINFFWMSKEIQCSCCHFGYQAWNHKLTVFPCHHPFLMFSTNFHSTGVITVAPGVELTVGRSYALTAEAMDNGPAPHRR